MFVLDEPEGFVDGKHFVEAATLSGAVDRVSVYKLTSYSEDEIREIRAMIAWLCRSARVECGRAHDYAPCTAGDAATPTIGTYPIARNPDRLSSARREGQGGSPRMPSPTAWPMVSA